MRNKRSEHREEDKKGDEQRPFICSPCSSHKALLIRKNFRDGKLVYVFNYTFLLFGKVKKKPESSEKSFLALLITQIPKKDYTDFS